MITVKDINVFSFFWPIVKSVIMANRYKKVSCSSSDLAIDKIFEDANLPKVLFCHKRLELCNICWRVDCY